MQRSNVPRSHGPRSLVPAHESKGTEIKVYRDVPQFAEGSEAYRMHQMLSQASCPLAERTDDVKDAPEDPPVTRTLCGKFEVADDLDSVVTTDHASKTLLLRGVWTGADNIRHRAILKLGEANNVGFLAERYYYTNILPRIRHQTPHVVAAYVTNCTVFASEFSDHVNVKWRDVGLRNEASALILRRAPGLSLKDVIVEHRSKWTSRTRDLFDFHIAVQVAHVLSVFAQEKFMHNDLHLKNLICQPLHEAYELPYMPDIRVLWFVRIFDFDQASVDPKAGIANPRLSPESSLCFRNGICQRFIANYDWVYFWTLFRRETRKTRAESFIPISLRMPDEPRNPTGNYRPCKPRASRKERCEIPTMALAVVVSPRRYLSETLPPVFATEAEQELRTHNRDTF